MVVSLMASSIYIHIICIHIYIYICNTSIYIYIYIYIYERIYRSFFIIYIYANIRKVS